MTDQTWNRETAAARVSVVLPTIGRPELIRSCLESLIDCDPRADEILVIDSSDDGGVERVVAEFADAGVRRMHLSTRGIGHALNHGIRSARHEFVLLTNDDCTVDRAWVQVAARELSRDAGAILTGRVRPHGDPEAVPSTIDDPVPREYVGEPDFVLFTQCMAARRSELLEFGGFDGRIQPTAEDNDLSYRWLRAGRVIRYEPEFVVWHRDWRSPQQLERLYVDYGIGQGMVYGKHLRRRDFAIVRPLVLSLYAVGRGVAARVVPDRRQWPDPRLGLLRGLPLGLVRGWRTGRG